jgi:SAM-dependent methyltransferase
MFALSTHDLQGRILGCGDGPASFNATATRRRGKVVSVDPLYAFSAAEIRKQIEATYAVILEQTRKNAAEFIWTDFESVEELGRARLVAMDEFLADFDEGRTAGRYLAAELPELPFANGAFDLALCSHFLFLYSGQLSEEFHLTSVTELCRVAREVRLFPLLQLGGARSPHLPAVVGHLEQIGCTARIEKVRYEFQRGGNQMLRILPAASIC